MGRLFFDVIKHEDAHEIMVGIQLRRIGQLPHFIAFAGMFFKVPDTLDFASK